MAGLLIFHLIFTIVNIMPWLSMGLCIFFLAI